MEGYIHSVQSFSTVDGPGIRSVVFLGGCPLRCIYCHNPDTWTMVGFPKSESSDIVGRLLRFKPYIKKGGVTFSGGEPLMQAAFVRECTELLHENGLHVALDTGGAVYNGEVDKLLDVIDMALLDVKFTSEEDYAKYTRGSLKKTLAFLDELEKRGKPTWIRHVVVPELNDNEQDILRLKELLRPYSVVRKIDLLPFRKLCLEKYNKLELKFKLKDTPELGNEKLEELNNILLQN